MSDTTDLLSLQCKAPYLDACTWMHGDVGLRRRASTIHMRACVAVRTAPYVDAGHCRC